MVVSISILFLNSTVNAQQLTEQQIIDIAQNVYQQQLSQAHRNEYVYGGLRQDDPRVSTFTVFWIRKINGVLVYGDRFYVRIDSIGGKVIDSHFDYSGNILQPITTISIDQAKWITSQKNWSLQKNPELQIREKELVWFVKLDNNCEATMNAKTGETKILGCPTGVSLPNPPVQFDPTQYFIEVQLPWIIGVLAITGIGGFVYYKKCGK